MPSGGRELLSSAPPFGVSVALCVVFFDGSILRPFSSRLRGYNSSGGDNMELTEKQIRKALRDHQRRVKELQNIYTDDHPMVSWHLKQISHLEEMLRPHGVG